MLQIGYIKILIGKVGGMAGKGIQKVVLALLPIGVIRYNVQFLETSLDLGCNPFQVLRLRMPKDDIEMAPYNARRIIIVDLV